MLITTGVKVPLVTKFVFRRYIISLDYLILIVLYTLIDYVKLFFLLTGRYITA